jgi:general secretion pathway protein G
MFNREHRLKFARRAVIAVTMAQAALAHCVAAGIAAAPLVVQSDASTQAKEAALKEALFRMREAIDRYYVDKKRYPNGLNALVTGKYIQKIPTDPLTGRTDSWRTIRARPAQNQRATAAGIYDVKSGSRGTALDGTRYSDW